MAGRARSPSTEIDLDLSSPATKKTKLSKEGDSPIVTTIVTTGIATPSNVLVQHQHQSPNETAASILETPYASDIYLESSEALPSSDESFGNEEGKITIEKSVKKRIQAEPSSSSSNASSSSLKEKLSNQQLSQDIMGGGDVDQTAFSLTGEHGGPYRDLVQIGDGAYGTVYKARDANTNQNVAMKRIRMTVTEDGLPTSTIREIAALKHINCLEHPHIVRLLDVCHGKDDNLDVPLFAQPDHGLTVWLIFEHVERDLAAFMSSRFGRKLSPNIVKQMSREILLAVDFLHSHRIIHRDLKPHNILVTKDGNIKIADFGLAKTYNYEMKLTTVVVTLWYRAPEVLLNCPYASPIDIWSVGCILAELNELKPLFPGSSEADQLNRIFRIIGSPPAEEWPENLSLSWSTFPFSHPKPMKLAIPHLSELGCDLIKSMLTFNPHQRITAAKALEHPYFTNENL